MLNYIKPLIFLIVLQTLCQVLSAQKCVIKIQTMLSAQPPLLLNPNNSNNTNNTNDAYHLPINQYGEVHVTPKDIINLTCPNSEVLLNGVTSKKSSLAIKCKNANLFEVIATGESLPIQNTKCSKRSTPQARYTGKTCLKNFKEIEIGYMLKANNSFLRDMTVCYDPKNQTTAYSSYNLTKFIGGAQYKVPRPQFDDGGFYNVGNHKVYQLYSIYVQRLNINRQLGLASSSKKYIGNGDFYLSRGHLTAKADFVYGHQQNATFFYVNAAPQWQTFNEGNWNSLEQNVRKMAFDQQRNVEVYTGTYGLATLPHEGSNVPTELYLYNENGKRGIPVPKIYWKIVYDRKTKAGVAFVGVNNPYDKNVTSQVLCKDMCNQIKWLGKWNRTNLTLGYSYCCEIQELRQKVDVIPYFKVDSVLV